MTITIYQSKIIMEEEYAQLDNFLQLPLVNDIINDLDDELIDMLFPFELESQEERNETITENEQKIELQIKKIKKITE